LGHCSQANDVSPLIFVLSAPIVFLIVHSVEASDDVIEGVGVMLLSMVYKLGMAFETFVLHVLVLLAVIVVANISPCFGVEPV
jgi:hypothetical protein